LSIKHRLQNIDRTLKKLPYFNSMKIHFVPWREYHFMTDEDRAAMTAPYAENLVIVELPTKDDEAEHGELLKQLRQQAKDERLNKYGRRI